MFGLDERQPLTLDRWLNDGDRVSAWGMTLLCYIVREYHAGTRGF